MISSSLYTKDESDRKSWSSYLPKLLRCYVPFSDV